MSNFSALIGDSTSSSPCIGPMFDSMASPASLTTMPATGPLPNALRSVPRICVPSAEVRKKRTCTGGGGGVSIEACAFAPAAKGVAAAGAGAPAVAAAGAGT